MIERAPQKADKQYGRNELAEFFYLFHSFCIFR